MENDQSDRPPPYYSVAVPTQPPPQYGEVVGARGWGDPLSQPYYIPQPMPPINVVEVSHSTPPRRKNRPSCGNSACCKGGSGGAFLLMVLLGISIWLGVRYGPTLVAGYLSGSETYRPSDLEKDSCPSNTVECDGFQDCRLGSDETNCVRFGMNWALQVKTNSSGSFLPVCYSGWNVAQAKEACTQLGFRASYSTSKVKDGSLNTLTVTGKTSKTIQGRLSLHSSSCPDKDAVNLQCIHCGQQQSSRIIGGSVVNPGDWPWQVSLHFLRSHICGGTLVAPDFVVTAAHCFPSKDSSYLVPSNWRVYVGMVSQINLPSPAMVDKIIVHESYDGNTKNYDITLLKLTQRVEFSKSVQPVCLPAYDKTFPPGTRCWTSGFGTTKEGAAGGSTSLMAVSVDIIDSLVCNKKTVYNGQVTVNMLCAGKLTGGKDSCQGDSGGPLMCMDSDQLWYLTGVTSWGVGCGRRNSPGVYSNVSSLLPWIYSKMQQSRP
ncbi:transmembrane protease serine 13b isoform X1 [Esox lucius]|uniref:Peptidase S1 domain-containing protein n=1 Tax=Esox lucius TaxID=8010 RepID=A0A3P8XTI8_ESOLU|nr:transmembrane protease serine 13b isoform X1 [Esox lucius]